MNELIALKEEILKECENIEYYNSVYIKKLFFRFFTRLAWICFNRGYYKKANERFFIDLSTFYTDDKFREIDLQFLKREAPEYQYNIGEKVVNQRIMLDIGFFIEDVDNNQAINCVLSGHRKRMPLVGPASYSTIFESNYKIGFGHEVPQDDHTTEIHIKDATFADFMIFKDQLENILNYLERN